MPLGPISVGCSPASRQLTSSTPDTTSRSEITTPPPAFVIANMSSIRVDTGIWGFQPSTAANAVFLALFFVLTLVHLWARVRLRANFFDALIVGGIFEIVGYATRAAATTNLTSIAPYAVQGLFLLLAPVLFSATCYMTLGRIIYATRAEQFSIIRLKWLTKTFVICDIICFCVQAGGGSLQSITSSDLVPKIGKWVVVVGLILQILAFGSFCLVAIKFHQRFRRSQYHQANASDVPWRRLLHVLYSTSALIIIRNIVRVVEYAQGFKGWIITHEIMLFLFDALPMMLLLFILLVWHPGRLLRGRLEGYNAVKK